MWFLWWTITQQRKAVTVLQEVAESQLCIITEFYYILQASMAAQGFLLVADMHTGNMLILFSFIHTEKN